MKPFTCILLWVMAIFLPLFGQSKVWTADNIPMVHLQDARKYVCNPDGVLSAAVVDSMDAILYRLEKTKGVQTVVVVVKQVEDGDCYTFGMNLGRKYGIGNKKQNSGLIVVLSTDDRKYYILTGFGLEGTLPDAICKRIENRVMVPLLKKGDWDGAMLQGVKAINGYIQGDDSLNAETDDEDSDGLTVFMLFGFFVALFIFVIAFSSARKCPRCGKKAYVRTADKFLYTRDGWDYYQVVSSCRRCKYSESVIERRKHEDDDGSGLLIGAAIGSMLGSHGSSSGFSGGSFGGGSFGGGGAGGSF